MKRFFVARNLCLTVSHASSISNVNKRGNTRVVHCYDNVVLAEASPPTAPTVTILPIFYITHTFWSKKNEQPKRLGFLCFDPNAYSAYVNLVDAQVYLSLHEKSLDLDQMFVTFTYVGAYDIDSYICIYFAVRIY